VITSIQSLLKDIRKQYPEDKLSTYEVELIIARLTQLSRAQIKAYPEKYIEEKIVNAIQQYCKKRVEGKPMAYLFNEREFWSLSFYVDEHVLIPRHESELMIEYCVERYNKKSTLTCLDLGTGSGALALALAKEFPVWQLIATDNSMHALNIAKKNARMLSINNVTFYQSDWFSAFQHQKFDVIISNPPYIAENDPHLLKGDLLSEPKSALVSSKDGMADLTQIVYQAQYHLITGGEIILEHGFMQGAAVRKLLFKAGYQSVKTFQDYANLDRYTVGTYIAN